MAKPETIAARQAGHSFFCACATHSDHGHTVNQSLRRLLLMFWFWHVAWQLQRHAVAIEPL